mgnify:FL=1
MRQTWSKALTNPYFVIGSVMIALLLILMAWGMAGPPHDPNFIDMSQSSQPPGPQHWFGTDTLGRDVFSRVLAAAKNAFGTGLLSTVISLFLGCLLGLISGFSRPAADALLTRMMDVMRCIPNLLFAMMLIALFGAGFFNTVAAICFINIPNFYRITRGSVLQIKSREYVTWARLAGIPFWRTVLTHILPNILSPIIVMTSMTMAQAVLTETSLSYLGLGIQPPDPSWGQMLADAQRNILTAPWEALSVGVCISLLVLGFNLLGDGLRDILDVRNV